MFDKPMLGLFHHFLLNGYEFYLLFHQKLEQDFSVTLPASYKEFLLKLGCGALGSTEIFGLGCPETGVPNIRFVVNALKKCGQQFPQGIIPISEGNEGFFVCLICKNTDIFEAGNVIACRASNSPQEALESASLLASGFDTFCLLKIAAQKQ